MNKLKLTIVGMLIASLGIGVINAQDKTAASTAKTSKKSTTAKSSTGTSQPATKTTGAKANTNASGQHLKKDGTPDMRYKENKAAKPATATPAKKGTSSKKGAPDKTASGNDKGM